MLLREPHVQTALNVQEQTESQDVREDREEIDTGGTHRPTGVEKEGEDELLELVEDTVIDQEVVIEAGQEELDEEHPERHHLDEEQQLQLE